MKQSINNENDFRQNSYKTDNYGSLRYTSDITLSTNMNIHMYKGNTLKNQCMYKLCISIDSICK